MKTHETLSINRAKEILKAYGGDPQRWPVQERGAMEAVLAGSHELQILQREVGLLDRSLDQYHVRPTVTPQAILALIDAREAEGAGGVIPSVNTTASKPSDWSGWLELALDWLIPPESFDSGKTTIPSLIWRGALAAMVPLGVGLWLGGVMMSPADDWSDSEQFVFAPFAQEVIDG